MQLQCMTISCATAGSITSPPPATNSDGTTPTIPNSTAEVEDSTATLHPAPNSLRIFDAVGSGNPPEFIHATFPSITWREPPNRDFFNTVLMGPNMAISTFARVRVRVSADWVGEGDQGGLMLYMPARTSTSGAKQRWFKAGIQRVGGRACESVVATDEWSDWSCAPVRERSDDDDDADDDDAHRGASAGAALTLEIERDREGTGSRWRSGVSVYVVEGETRRRIRQCTWFFEGMDESKRMLVAMYANKPTQDEREELLVRFDDFEVFKR